MYMFKELTIKPLKGNTIRNFCKDKYDKKSRSHIEPTQINS